MSTQQLQDQLNTLQSEVDGLKRISELPNRVTADGTEKIAVDVLGTEYKMDASVFFGDGGKTVDGDYTLQEKDRGLNIYITGAARTLTIPASLGWARTNDCKVMFEQAGFTINDAAVTANYPQTVQDVAKSIFRIFKTGTDEFNITQEGAATTPVAFSAVTDIHLTLAGTLNNQTTPSAAASFNILSAVLKGEAEIAIDTTGKTAFPTITESASPSLSLEPLSGSEFEPDSIFDLYLRYNGVKVQYFFLKR